ncbi:uncharacterized protein [Dysidea avara]|uniref:uncharacterized protein isoform X2 n=1 Tax=Dysidea avara TaxID=196820 RepID=UPI0033203B97
MANRVPIKEGLVKIKFKHRQHWKTRHVALMKGLPDAPHIILVYKTADKEELEYSREVNIVTVNKSQIMLNKNELYLQMDDQMDHVQWIVALKLAVTKYEYFPVKHYGISDNEFSLLHIEDVSWSDLTRHDMIILSSPYDDTEVRHRWASVEIKLLRAVHEGVFIEFCPQCSKSQNFVRLGFTLRLPQEKIEDCLEFFCRNTSAQHKKDEAYICEMMDHYKQCVRRPPSVPAPTPPPSTSNTHLTLYGVTDIIKHPALTRASKSLIKVKNSSAPAVSPKSQSQGKLPPRAKPRVQTKPQSKDEPDTSKVAKKESNQMQKDINMLRVLANTRKPPQVKPRRKAGQTIQQGSGNNGPNEQLSSMSASVVKPVPKARVKPASDHKDVYDDMVSSGQPMSNINVHHPALVQSNSATASVERIAVVHKKPLVKQSTVPFQKDLPNDAPRHFLHVKAQTTIFPSANVNSLKDKISEQMTGKEHSDIKKGSITTNVPVNEEGTNSGTLPERKHPTTISEQAWRNAFKAFL